VDPSRLCGPSFPNVFSPDRHPLLCDLIRRFFDEIWASRPHRELRVRAIVLEIMVELSRLKGLQSPLPQERGRSAAERIAPSLDHIAANYSRQLRVGELSERCALGATQFRKLFTVTTGKSPQRYLAEMRVGMASAMLAGSSKPIGRIAAECGFATLSSFNRAFRAVTRTTPRDWRRSRGTGAWASGAPPSASFSRTSRRTRSCAGRAS
jgi:AraC family transcriptional activator of mtrCDE